MLSGVRSKGWLAVNFNTIVSAPLLQRLLLRPRLIVVPLLQLVTAFQEPPKAKVRASPATYLSRPRLSAWKKLRREPQNKLLPKTQVILMRNRKVLLRVDIFG